ERAPDAGGLGRAGLIAQLAQAGDLATAGRLAGSVLANPSQSFPSGTLGLYLALGRTEEGLEYLALEKRQFFLRILILEALDPIFDDVREDPRFLRKLEEIGALAAYRDAWAYVAARKGKEKR